MIFEFRSAEFLWFLLLVPVVWYFYVRERREGSIIFSSVGLVGEWMRGASVSRQCLGILRVMGLVFLVLGMARPQLGVGESYEDVNGIDIMLAVDLSGSMMAVDMSPSAVEMVTRVDAAKRVVEDFIEKRAHDRIGMVGFAGGPYLVSPLTLNHDWLAKNLKRLRVGMIPDGTAIGNAIVMCVNRLKEGKGKSKVIILMTDGENTAGNIAPLTAAEIAEKFGIKIYTVGVGKSDHAHVLVLDKNGEIAKNMYGQPNMVEAYMPVDLEVLQKIADKTGGKSYKASSPEELEKIYGIIDKLEKTEIKVKSYARYEEYFMVPVIIGLGIILLERLLANSRFLRIP